MRKASILLIVLLSVTSRLSAQDKGYDVRSYTATLHLDRLRDSLWGEVTMTAVATRDLATVDKQFIKYLQIEEVQVNGVTGIAYNVDTLTGEYRVASYSGSSLYLQKGNQFRIRTVYHGHPRVEQWGANWGGVSARDTMMFAMGVGINAPYTSTTRHWLPCYDLPDDKADSVELYFWTDSSEVVASNGVGDVSFVNGRRLTHWFESKPIATYLLTFAVGPYTLTDYFSTTGVGGQMFALRRDSVAANKVYADLIGPSVAFFDSLFAQYPFEKVGYVVTPIGAMEHQTMICLDKTSLADAWSNTVPSHELAHQWWGDWVTCKTFDDAWLNEGFATFCEALVHERFQGHDAYINALVADRIQEVNVVRGKMKIDSLPIFGAATADHHTNNYPPTIYKKGAVVLGMLRQYFGDAFFFQALRTYGKSHAYSNVTTLDLQQTIESMSGQRLGWFFQQFVYERGAPVVDVHYTVNGNSVTMDLTQVQDSLGYRFFRMPLQVKAYSNGGTENAAIWIDSVKTTEVQVNFSFTPDSVVIDPDRTALIAMRFVSRTSGVGSTKRPEATISLYPNPSTGSVRIAIATPVEERWTELEVFDERGASLRRFALDTMASRFEKLLDLRELAAGNYTIVASTASGHQYVDRVTLK